MRRLLSRRYLVASALATAACAVVLLLVFASPWASKSPDSLEKVVRDKGLTSTESTAAPASDYKLPGVKNQATSTRLSALIGVAVTLLAAIGLGLLVTRLGRRRRGTGDAGPAAGRGIEGGPPDEA